MFSVPSGLVSLRAARSAVLIDWNVWSGSQWRRTVVLWCFRRSVQVSGEGAVEVDMVWWGVIVGEGDCE